MRTRGQLWSAVDPLVAGPYRPYGSIGSGAATAFEVPSADNGFGFGRLESGPAWPEGLPPLERLAAVPSSVESLDAPDERAVLWLRSPAGDRSLLCTRDVDRTRWAVDPVRWIEGLLGERYVAGWRRPLPSRIPVLNYARVPQVVKGWLEPLQSPRDRGTPSPVEFPRLPLDDLVETLRRLCATLAYEAPVRLAAPWPDGHRAAITVTHDVDTPWILDPARSPLLGALLEAEGSAGMRGAWYVTARPLRAKHSPALARITDRGHEIGAHGWNHDSKLDYVGVRRQKRRMRLVLERFGDRPIAGIRTPWNSRSPRLLEVLSESFEYDSSVPNANGFYSAVTRSGCCSVFPYRHASGIVELPATLPPDTSLGSSGYDVLAPVVDRIVELGGVVVVTVHPQPHQSGHREGIAALGSFLAATFQRHGNSLWRATPREIVRRYVEAAG